MATFKTFLEGYCAELSGLETRSLKAFAFALPDTPRLKEPLLLLALEEGREGFLLRQMEKVAAQGDGRRFNWATILKEFRTFSDAFATSGVSLTDYLETLPQENRYRKCLMSWESAQSQTARDRRFLASMPDQLGELIAYRGFTRAEACRIAGLNKGNFYAFLKGDFTKLSRETAVAAYDAIASYGISLQPDAGDAELVGAC